jgi:hypothetical protein
MPQMPIISGSSREDIFWAPNLTKLSMYVTNMMSREMNSIQSLFLTADIRESTSSSFLSAQSTTSSLSSKIEAENVKNGQVMFHPSDSFAVFVRIVESSVFTHLFGGYEEEREVVSKEVKRSAKSHAQH